MPRCDVEEYYDENGTLRHRKINMSNSTFEEAVNGVNELINRATGQNNPPIYPPPKPPERKRLTGD